MKKKNVKIAALFVAMVFVVGSLFAQSSTPTERSKTTRWVFASTRLTMV